MSALKTSLVIILLFLIIIGFSSVYTITEGHEGLLLRLGKLEKDPKTNTVTVYQPGLHFKWPFIEKARVFDTRLQTLDMSTSRIVTAEKKDVIVDYYIKWRIINLPLYYTRTGGNQQVTNNLLQQQLNDSIRSQFGRRTISEVVADERSKIMVELLKEANRDIDNLGISVLDVRIKRIDLPTIVSQSVFNRMRAERERTATHYRSEGKAAGEAIRAQADARVTVIIAKAKAHAATIRAVGQAQAARIYANAYSKDPNFYAFYRSIDAYQNTFRNKNDMLVLRPGSQFFNYFNSANSSSAKDNKTTKR